MTLNILIVDDHTITRLGLREILTSGLQVGTIGEAQDAAEALAMIQQEQWSFLLLDISLPGESGIALLKKLKVEHPQLPVLVFSFYSADQIASRVIKLGAAGYLSKDSQPEEWIEAVNGILRGECYTGRPPAESPSGHREKRSPLETLSEREREVFGGIVAGKSIGEIAEELGVGHGTVSTYRRRLLTKMHLHSNLDLIRYAARSNLFDTSLYEREKD